MPPGLIGTHLAPMAGNMLRLIINNETTTVEPEEASGSGEAGESLCMPPKSHDLGCNGDLDGKVIPLFTLEIQCRRCRKWFRLARPSQRYCGQCGVIARRSRTHRMAA